MPAGEGEAAGTRLAWGGSRRGREGRRRRPAAHRSKRDGWVAAWLGGVEGASWVAGGGAASARGAGAGIPRSRLEGHCWISSLPTSRMGKRHSGPKGRPVFALCRVSCARGDARVCARVCTYGSYPVAPFVGVAWPSEESSLAYSLVARVCESYMRHVLTCVCRQPQNTQDAATTHHQHTQQGSSGVPSGADTGSHGTRHTGQAASGDRASHIYEYVSCEVCAVVWVNSGGS